MARTRPNLCRSMSAPTPPVACWARCSASWRTGRPSRLRHRVSASTMCCARIWTIGYEKLLPEALAAELQAAGVRRLIDVRQRPQSRRPGMSKTRLAAFLAEHGITYEHRRALGTPTDLRWL